MFGGFNFGRRNPLEALFGGYTAETPTPTFFPDQAFPQPNPTPMQGPLNDIPPPASSRAIQNLNMVQVTADDLIEETNKECLICLCEQELGSQCTKLPCGHLYHRNCLVEWLEKHCTCPVCRYEIESADPYYENMRRERMKSRKLRYRRDELEAKSIHDLRDLMRNLSVSYIGCLDKRDLVDRLVESQKITIVEGVPIIEMSSEQFNNLGVAGLRKLMKDFGISSVGAIEKSELRDRILTSGRVGLVEVDPSSPDETSTEEKMEVAPDKDNAASEIINNESNKKGRFQIHEEVLQTMNVRELMEFMHAFDISTTSCVEREEMFRRIRDSDNIEYLTS